MDFLPNLGGLLPLLINSTLNVLSSLTLSLLLQALDPFFFLCFVNLSNLGAQKTPEMSKIPVTFPKIWKPKF